MSDDLLPTSLDREGSTELGGEDAPLTESERADLSALAHLVGQAPHFELPLEARARGLAELESLLDRHEKRRSRTKPVVSWWWSVPLAAAVLLAWLLPLSPERAPVAVEPDELAVAQNAVLTARLTGGPIPEGELERAQTAYREKLLASLEHDR